VEPTHDQPDAEIWLLLHNHADATLRYRCEPMPLLLMYYHSKPAGHEVNAQCVSYSASQHWADTGLVLTHMRGSLLGCVPHQAQKDVLRAVLSTSPRPCADLNHCTGVSTSDTRAMGTCSTRHKHTALLLNQTAGKSTPACI
jgi:hypothetical protein